MKISHLIKTAGGTESLTLAEQDMALINQYTLRQHTAEEVFAFKVTLCDNRIDRDNERFTTAALHKLAELFFGKTGIFDHTPTAENQTARIYDADVVEDGGMSGDGEAYASLVGKAYMLRDESNLPTIRAIEAGILKEVSVGCAVNSTTCSVCGSDCLTDRCDHRKGEYYDGKQCYHILDDPTDAYEWSFVAVPAQKNAGVTKGLIKSECTAFRNAVAALRDAAETVLGLMSETEDVLEGGQTVNFAHLPEPSVKGLLGDVQKLLRETNRRMQNDY
jgi:hypothetical protein